MPKPLDTELLTPEPRDIELDKIPGFWVLTHWQRNRVALRLKIRHTCWEDPDDMICEVRVAPAREFTGIGGPITMSAYELEHPDEYPKAADDFPCLYRQAFVMMARRWAALSRVMELGGTLSARYEFEPGSSVDC